MAIELTTANAATITGIRTSLGYSRAAASGALTTLGAISFARVKADREINPIPDEFVFFDTQFQTSADLTLSTGATVTPGTGLTITKKTGTTICSYCVVTSNKFLAPVLAVEITVNTPSSASGTLRYIAAGITPRNLDYEQNYIAGYYDSQAGVVGVDIRRAGVQTAVAGSAIAVPTAPFRLLTVIYGNNVSIFINLGAGWVLAHVFQDVLATTWNLRSLWGTNDWAPVCFGHAQTGSYVVTRMRAGYAGYVGLQSLCYMKYEDGSPIIGPSGEYYMHAMANLPFTTAGSWTKAWAHTHGMAFAVDPTTYKITPIAQYIPFRDGQYRPDDGFGPLILDRDTGRWNWLTQNASQLGDVNAKILNYYSHANMLRGVHVLSDWHEIVVTGTKPRWDADAVKIGGTWHLSYTLRTEDLAAGTLYPALATSSSLTEPFTIVGSDPTQTAAEGTHLGKIGGTWYVLSSNAAGLLAYNLSMVLQRTIVPTGFVLGAAPHPHFNLVALPVGNRTKYIIDTFNRTTGLGGGNGTYGNREIYESPLYEGNEFPIDSVIPR